MTQSDIQESVSKALVAVAPELAAVVLDPAAPLRDQVDLDSMDFLRFVVQLHRELGVEIPEADYPKLSTLADIVGYLAARLGVPAH